MKLTSILLDAALTSDYTIIHQDAHNTTEQDNALANLSKINIFIGANNSGKSRLMRTLFVNNEFAYQRNDCDLNQLNIMIHEFHDIMSKEIAVQNGKTTTIPSLSAKANYKYFRIAYKLMADVSQELSMFFSRTFLIRIDNQEIPYSMSTLSRANPTKVIIQDYAGWIPSLAKKIEEGNTPFAKTYIPILRGLRPIHSDGGIHSFHQQNDYLHRTIFDYFKEEKESNKLSISTGLDFYDQLSHLKNGDVHEQDLVKEFETFLSKTFFQNEPIVITPHKRKDVVTFRIGKGEAHPIYDLGDGIQAIILLTYPLFFNKGKDMIFFFEGPEIYLHPGFQRIFIDTLLSKRFDSFQYFFTTHSNHFLDITLDHDNISIYNFRKEKGSANKFEIENVQSGNNSLLEELGVRNASVFLSNCTIWVEGISDRIYIRKYLDVLMQKDKNTEGGYFREDYHYSFVEYGGNNITHWSFLDNADDDVPNINVDRICKRIFLITDQDGAGGVDADGEVLKSKKHNRQEKLKAKLGEDHYDCLDCREIENALSPDILKTVIEGRRKKNKATENINFVGDWSYNAYQHKPLGQFIQDNIDQASRDALRTYNDGGTIHDKIGFAKSAVEAIKSFEDLSQPAKNLTEKIYAFIKKSNE